MFTRGYADPSLSAEAYEQLSRRARQARGDILTMTTLAGCGHPGGSMSSIEMYLLLFGGARLNPEAPGTFDRDRIVISHGHTSPGAYAALAQCGFCDRDAAISQFRYPGSVYEGHVERAVAGIEWGTGNLGQGLSAGCAFALAARLHNSAWHAYVVMGDGEQQKGQISEARRFAVKYRLNNLTALIDLNGLQISGQTDQVMPQRIADNFRADGWQVLDVDGHDLHALYQALHTATRAQDQPVAILARTVMGKGVSFMENQAKYHGAALNEQQYAEAMQELELQPALDRFRQQRAACAPVLDSHGAALPGAVEPARISVARSYTPDSAPYDADTVTDNRSAFGRALADIARTAAADPSLPPVAVFDCDLAGSVKTTEFASILPDRFFECGIQEHHTATMAGAISTAGVLPFFADFGVFGVCETYNQHRLSDINHSNLKLVCTHIGLDVGEDGKTHQCLDYIGMLRNIFGFRIITPADPNQTYWATRYIAAQAGNYFLGMGRSKVPVLCDADGTPLFGAGYTFTYGAIDRIRSGAHAAVVACGTMVHRAVAAADRLAQRGIRVGVYNASCPTCLDRTMLQEAAQTGLLLSYEDHHCDTGLGASIALELAALPQAVRLVRLGVRAYGLSGKPDNVYAAAGIGIDELVTTIETELSRPAR